MVFLFILQSIAYDYTKKLACHWLRAIRTQNQAINLPPSHPHPSMHKTIAKLLISSAALVWTTLGYADTFTLTQVENLSGPSSTPSAGTYSYDGNQRDAWLYSSIAGYAVKNVTGTPDAANVGTLFNGTWEKRGGLNAVGTDHWLTVALTQGTWGSGPLTGTWGIDKDFWKNFGRAVITMHVGNGGGNPDWFFWEITPKSLSGGFYYNRQTGGGGGLSNIFLWGSGTPTTNVPDGGVTAMLLGLAFLALGFARRMLT